MSHLHTGLYDFCMLFGGNGLINPPFLLALQIMGIERIIFSVDYPYSTNEQGCAFLDHAPISLADKEKLSHLNAERLLKLSS